MTEVGISVFEHPPAATRYTPSFANSGNEPWITVIPPFAMTVAMLCLCATSITLYCSEHPASFDTAAEPLGMPYTQFLQVLPDAAIVTDPSGVVGGWNNSTTQLFG